MKRFALLALMPVAAIACGNHAASPRDNIPDSGLGGDGGLGSGGREGPAGPQGTGGTQGPTGTGGGAGGGSSGGSGGGSGGAGAGTAGTLGSSGGRDAGVSPADGGPGGAGGSNPGGRDGGVGDVGGEGFNPCPTAAGAACTVLPLGDSITEGFLPSGANGGYRVEMFRQAVLGGKNLTFVGSLTNGPTTVANQTFPRRHEGHGGFTIAGGGVGAIAGLITDSAISSYHPTIVLLMIGTNDVNGNINVASAPTRLGQLIDEIIADAPSALVVVATIIPIADSNTNQRVQTFNAAIPNLVNTRVAAGKHIALVDSYAAFVKDPTFRTSLMVDNLHPNEAGYAILGRTFYDAISGLLQPGP
jgi:lysophospholipase L1-like esterase